MACYTKKSEISSPPTGRRQCNAECKQTELAEICQRGNLVVFGEHGGYVLNLSDGSKTAFGVEDNVYVLDLYMPPFGRQVP